jgi:hypothetical protein
VQHVRARASARHAVPIGLNAMAVSCINAMSGSPARQCCQSPQ